jgi:4a-hydroxytetrahydrobiopterin dehydratase
MSRSKLDAAALERFFDVAPGWASRDAAIVKTYTFDAYRSALAFAVEVAMLAEKEDHHPDLTIRYGGVEVFFTTHDAGGVTARDTELARACDEVFLGRSAR